MRRLVLTTVAVAMLGAGAAYAQGAMPMADPNAHGNPAINTRHSDAADMAKRGANSFTEGQARKRIMKAGYSDVSALTKDSDGLWQGTAMRHHKSVNVALDFKGNVITR